jgi:hypothetical protein
LDWNLGRFLLYLLISYVPFGFIISRMSLSEEVSFDKDGNIEPGGFRGLIFRRLFLSLAIILVAGLSFGMGRLSVVGKRTGVRVEFDPSISNSQFPISNEASASGALNSIENSKPARPAGGLEIENSSSVVGSSKGSKYHYSHCPGAKQISEANRITFPSPKDAEAAGYTLAANCKPK